jgi:AAA+ ATPase superfamily predicted ATPase
VRLPFLDREDELGRLRRLLTRRQGGLGILYGRRRCGKSRLVREALPGARSVYYVGDDREAALQRSAFAVEVGRLLPGFAEAVYPDWDALFARLFREAGRGTVVAMDELPALVQSAPEIPSLLQKHVDLGTGGAHLVLAGSSQSMMQGLVLDRTAPLFGRAQEILRIDPLEAGWIREGLRLSDDRAAVRAYAVWGGVPRYWELAADYGDLRRAVRELALSPLGALHDEPSALLHDDLRDVTQASSLLTLIGAGCHRLSEIAGRLAKPATSLTRPLARLIDLGLVRRDLPFGAHPRNSKRSAYRIADPFLRFWFRFVEPNRSRLEARLLDAVARDVERELPLHVSGVFEDLVRRSIPRAGSFGRQWGAAAPWWGPGRDRSPMEVDAVAESDDRRELLVGEVKWSEKVDVGREIALLRRKAANLPLAEGRRVRVALWAPTARRVRGEDYASFTPRDVLRVLR